MPVTQRYKLNIVPEGTPVVVHASQYDAQSRDFYFTIYNGSELFEIPSGSAVTVRGTKPDNTGFEYSATYSGSLVHVIVEAQMTVLPGNVRSEIRITNGAQILGTANFILRVESAGLSDDTQISETELPLIEKAAAAGALASQVGNNTSAINTLSARMDEFTRLPDGSTSGDAELADIRIGSDGYNYGQAGEATRGQTRRALSATERLTNVQFGIANNKFPIEWFESGGISESGDNSTWRINSRARMTEPMKFDEIVAIRSLTGNFDLFLYDENLQFVSHTSWVNPLTWQTVPANTYFRVLVSLDRAAAAATVIHLEDNVNDLEFSADQVSKPLIFDKIHFEHGSIEDGADNAYRQFGRIRTKGIVELPFDIEVSASTGQIYFHYFDEDGNFISKEGWITTQTVTIPAFQKFRFVYTLNNAANVYVPVEEVLQTLTIKKKKNHSISTYPAKPNMIFQLRNFESVPYESKWSVKLASKNQYDRVRFTVRKTTEGIYFNCHDTNINRYVLNPDGTELSEPYAANDRTLDELNQFDWGLKYGEKYRGATVPLLEETLKYASLYNLGVTYHSATANVDNDTDAGEILKLFDKYGLIDNMIVIVSNAQYKQIMTYYRDYNPHISFFVGGTFEYLQTNVENIKALKTAHNKIYTQLFPWGTQPTQDMLEWAYSNGFTLYDSTAMSEAQLLTVEKFNKGFTVMEVNDVYMVKDKVYEWADSLIE